MEITFRFRAQYNDNLMFGNPRADLCGRWKDEIPAMEKGLADLQTKLANAPATQATPTTVPSHLLLTRLSSPYVPPAVSHDPITTLPAGQPLTITATVRSDAGIKWVRLRCRSVNQRLDYEQIPMSPTGKPDQYQAIVPPEKIPAKWDFMYYIEAMDTRGQGCVYPDAQQRTPYVIVKLQRD